MKTETKVEMKNEMKQEMKQEQKMDEMKMEMKQTESNKIEIKEEIKQIESNNNNKTFEESDTMDFMINNNNDNNSNKNEIKEQELTIEDDDDFEENQTELDRFKNTLAIGITLLKHDRAGNTRSRTIFSSDLCKTIEWREPPAEKSLIRRVSKKII